MKIHLFSAAVLVFATSASYGQSQPVQWRVEDGGNGHWYQVVNLAGAGKVDWLASRTSAIAAGGDLATFTTAAETNAFLSLTVGFTRGNPWIGLEQDSSASDFSEPTGGWRWTSGEPLNWTNWAPGEPNNAGPENWAIMWIDYGPPGTWNDYRPSNPQGPDGYVIEWSADCNNDGIVDYGQILSGQVPDSNSNGVPDTCEAPPCPADINHSGAVNGVDLALVLSAWGTNGNGEFQTDISNDGIVNGQDLAFVLGAWGPCSTVPAWATVIEFLPNPAVVTDPTLRAAISSTGLPWRVRDTATQIELLLVPPGTFMMGCSQAPTGTSCNESALPVHPVTITQPFYLGRYEVTQAQWQARMGNNPALFQSASPQVPASEVPNRPVERVSWNTVAGTGNSFMTLTGLRLPTEAEWEYACRAGTTSAFHNGSSNSATLGDIAWFSGNSNGQTHPVGQKASNALGFHDMLGNVWEWVNDWYDSYSASAQTNPTGPSSGSHYVVRAGSWLYDASQVNSSRRFPNLPNQADPGGGVGFRVARNP